MYMFKTASFYAFSFTFYKNVFSSTLCTLFGIRLYARVCVWVAWNGVGSRASGVRLLMRLVLEEIQPQMKIQLHFRCLLQALKSRRTFSKLVTTEAQHP